MNRHNNQMQMTEAPEAPEEEIMQKKAVNRHREQMDMTEAPEEEVQSAQPQPEQRQP